MKYYLSKTFNKLKFNLQNKNPSYKFDTLSEWLLHNWSSLKKSKLCLVNFPTFNLDLKLMLLLNYWRSIKLSFYNAFIVINPSKDISIKNNYPYGALKQHSDWAFLSVFYFNLFYEQIKISKKKIYFPKFYEFLSFPYMIKSKCPKKRKRNKNHLTKVIFYHLKL